MKLRVLGRQPKQKTRRTKKEKGNSQCKAARLLIGDGVRVSLSVSRLCLLCQHNGVHRRYSRAHHEGWRRPRRALPPGQVRRGRQHHIPETASNKVRTVLCVVRCLVIERSRRTNEYLNKKGSGTFKCRSSNPSPDQTKKDTTRHGKSRHANKRGKRSHGLCRGERESDVCHLTRCKCDRHLLRLKWQSSLSLSARQEIKI
jgi:hypothetical protein